MADSATAEAAQRAVTRRMKYLLLGKSCRLPARVNSAGAASALATSADRDCVWRNRVWVQTGNAVHAGKSPQNEQAPLASMPLLMVSTSTKVGKVALTTA